MDSDEEGELAELRAARSARHGGEAATLSQLRILQQRAQQSQQQRGEQPAAHGPPRPPPAVGPPRPPPRPANSDDDNDDDEGPVVVGDVMEEEADRMDDEMRAALPMSFGRQEVKLARADAVHSQTKRKDVAFGPPRPPPKQQQAAAAAPAVGPPRPPPRDESGGAEEEGDEVGPPRPPGGWGGGDGSDEEQEGRMADGRAREEEEEEEEEEDPYRLPVSNEVVLSGADRAVTCVDIEHTGSRVAAGGIDNVVRLYDFQGMRSDLRPFREITPCDGHPVHSVSWSPTGDAFLAVTGSAQAKIFDRDGREKGEFVRGDMYIRDMRNTKGHVSGLTGGMWHPTDRFTAMTGSEDGTVRIWDTWNVQQKTVIKPTLSAPGRVAVTSVAYNSDGRLIAAGLMDGTIQVWTVGGKFGRSAAVGAVQPPSAQHIEKQGWTYVSKPTQLAKRAHEPQTEITGLAFTQDDTTLVSRGTDGTLRLWDLRNFKSPLKIFAGLPANYSNTNVAFSPDERLVLTGTAADDPRGAGGGDGGGGAVVFIDRKELKLVRRLGMPAHAAAVRWHDRLNQIFVGVGNRKSGGCHILYDPTFSERGALVPVARAPRAASALDLAVPLIIKTPHALPAFREDPHVGQKRGREPQKTERAKALRPDPGPSAGAGRQGRIGTTGGTLLTQHLLKQRGGLVGVEEEMDPREAILRHAGKQDVISQLTKAYAKTQPAPIFAEPSEEEEEEGEGAEGE